jgi:nudix-type nucleoside diphosphatase (YffH/AdpP family)
MKIEGIEVFHEGFERNMLVTVRLRNGGTHAYQVDDHGSGASVLPYDPERRVATLVLQKRAPMQLNGDEPALLEAPGGIVEGDGPEHSARREVLEEAGLRIGELQPVALFWSMPGISTERVHLYLAPYTRKDRIGAGGGLQAEGEDIEVVEVALSELAEMADLGTLLDLRTFAAVQSLRLRRPELFS